MKFRKLSTNEINEISKFTSKLRVYTTPWQPTASQQEYDEKTPGKIKELLLRLLPKSINDHLISKYLPHLNTNNYQDAILSWLESIDALSSNMKHSDTFKDDGLVHQVLFREATRLAIETSMRFASHTLAVITKLPYFTSPEALMKLSLEAIERFNKQKSDDIRLGIDKEATGAYGYYYETFIDSETLREQLLAKQPAVIRFNPKILHRTRSDSAAMRHTKDANVVSPIRFYQPIDRSELCPIKMPRF